MKQLGIGAAVGVLLSFFLDPQSGKRRRHQLWFRTAGLVRRGARKTQYAARGVSAEAYGMRQKAAHLREEPKAQPNDATLAAKVESEVLRDADMPKGRINVNAENGVVILRGEVESPELIEELVAKARKVHGVQGIENLLHLPGTEAPMHRAHAT